MGYYYCTTDWMWEVEEPHLDDLKDTLDFLYADSQHGDLEGYFNDQGFGIDYDEHNSLYIHDCEEVKLRGQQEFLESVAMYSKEGSFMECRGEDGCLWKWFIKNGALHEVEGKIVYDE